MDYRAEKIQECTDKALQMMNENRSFEGMRNYLEEAFSLCSPLQDLAYYQIIATVFSKLYFRTKTAIGTSKVKKQYELLFDYFDEKFSKIVNFNADINCDEEARLVNSICCDIFNGAQRYYQAFANAYMNGGMIWGFIGIWVSHRKLKTFREHIKSYGKNAACILRKYNANDIEILQNIRVFENGK